MLDTTFTTCHPDALISAIAEGSAATTGDVRDKTIEDLKKIIARRSANGKRFGKLEIRAQQHPHPQDEEYATDEERKEKTIHYLTAFVLDISSSMSGPKIEHARNTIIKFLEVLLAESAASAMKIKTWFYLITFNDRANVAVQLQEVTDLTIGPMIETINKITASGSTSYEAAFHCNSNYLRDILHSPTSFTSASASASAAKPPKQLHIVKFFETDGDITYGCSNLTTLYQVMHDQPTPHEAYKNTLFTYEDCVFGYGADVDTKCLKTLAAPHPPKFQQSNTSAATTPAVVATHCSSFCSIGKPEDIGWQVGELLFKLITRCGAYISVSVNQTADTATTATVDTIATTATTTQDPVIDTQGPVVGGRNPHTVVDTQGLVVDTQGPVVGGRNPQRNPHTVVGGRNPQRNPQLFEYQTHTWNSQTTLHSIAANETKTIFVQFDGSLQNFDNSIEMTDQLTGRRYKYKFRHEITDTTATAATTTTTSPHSESDILSMILGMMQIEIFKLMREMEADHTVYDADTLVAETYKMMRILKHIKQGQILQPQQPQQPQQPDATTTTIPMTPEMRWLENLITDTKVLIGLTTISAKNEQLAIIHARRTSSAEHEFFSTGQKAFGEYIDGEEFHEQAAKDAISEYTKKIQAGCEYYDGASSPAQAQAQAQAEDQFNDFNDCIPSRVATASHYSQSDAIDTPYPGGGGGSSCRNSGGRYNYNSKQSILRTLCARIAIAAENKEDIKIEEMCQNIFRGEYNDDHHRHHHRHHQSPGGDETFSSIPDDEHSSRRVRMMRQMSTPMSLA
jgi:hypothetical protein